MPGSWNAPPWCLAGQTWDSTRPPLSPAYRGCVSLLRRHERPTSASLDDRAAHHGPPGPGGSNSARPLGARSADALAARSPASVSTPDTTAPRVHAARPDTSSSLPLRLPSSRLTKSKPGSEVSGKPGQAQSAIRGPSPTATSLRHQSLPRNPCRVRVPSQLMARSFASS